LAVGPDTSSSGPIPAGPGPPGDPREDLRVDLARIVEAISSSVENPGSSKQPLTSRSNAILIKSGGLFFRVAASRIASAATLRAPAGSRTTPSR
jgi:hypothetical protein